MSALPQAEPPPIGRPPPMPQETLNLRALTLLLEFFHDMTDSPIADRALFALETRVRWKLWEDATPVELRCERLGGKFVLNLLERTLRVRFLEDEAGCVARLLIRVDSPIGLMAQAVEFADHPKASDVGVALLARIQDTEELRTLEWSLAKAMAYRLAVGDLARELVMEVATVKK